MFLVDNRMWNVFLQTGNVEAYLLVKQLEQQNEEDEDERYQSDIGMTLEMKD